MKASRRLVTAAVCSALAGAASAQPCAPTVVGSVSSIGSGSQVSVQNGFAYVANESAGLRIFDVSTPTNPTLVSTLAFPFNENARGVAVSGSFAYVSTFFGNLFVVDISNPATPTIAASQSSPGMQGGQMTLSAGFAYVAAFASGLVIFDVRDPLHPFHARTLATTVNDALSVAVDGNFAYVGEDAQPSTLMLGGVLNVIDVTIPANPSIIGTLTTPTGIHGVAVVNNVAYLTMELTGFETVDLSCKTNPIMLATLPTAGSSAPAGVVVTGGLAYVADFSPGLEVIDVADPAAPVALGTTSITGGAGRLSVQGAAAYAVGSSGTGLQVLNIQSCLPPTPCVADLNGDGVVDGADIAVLLNAFGPCAP